MICIVLILGILQNMWDLTPDTDILQELPAEYTFETALADLIVSQWDVFFIKFVAVIVAL